MPRTLSLSLGCSLLLLAGCSGRSDPPKEEAPIVTKEKVTIQVKESVTKEKVTIHVKDMTKDLKLE